MLKPSTPREQEQRNARLGFAIFMRLAHCIFNKYHNNGRMKMLADHSFRWRTAGVILVAALGLLGTGLAVGLLLMNPARTGKSLDEDQAAVRRVLDLDGHHFKGIRERQQLWDPGSRDDLVELVRLARDYRGNIADIDLSECPLAFRKAFTTHAREWGKVLRELADILKTTRGDDEEGKGEALAAAVRSATRPLDRSWERVKEAGNAVGVFVRD